MSWFEAFWLVLRLGSAVATAVLVILTGISLVALIARGIEELWL